LSGLYESTKRELENSIDVSEDLRILLLYKEGKRREKPTVGGGRDRQKGVRERQRERE
jgi:hypothetical protein